MAISGTENTLKKISSQIESQFPGFIREEGPQFVAFMKAYFEYMEQEGNPVNAVRSLRDNLDIDRTVDSFVEYFRKEFMINIPQSALADKRLLTKHIKEFYRAKGSQESYRFLFRALFNSELEFYYPGEDILRASDGRWIRETKLRVGKPYSINPRLMGGTNVRGLISGASALVQSITSTIASGLTIYDMVVENVSGIFLDGERVVDDAGNYVTVSAQVGSLSGVEIRNGGAFHNINDIIEIGGAGSTEAAQGIVISTTNDSAVEIRITNSGSGYTKENTRLYVSGGNGTGFQARVSSWTREPIATTLGVDIISPLKNVQIGAGPFFVAGGANTASVRQRLSGTVSTSTTSNIITGISTQFVDQLSVGKYVRVQGSSDKFKVTNVLNNLQIQVLTNPTTTLSGKFIYTGLAAANAYSTINEALEFSANSYYAINAISILNPGYGYTTMPTISIVDLETSPLNVFDGHGNYLGRNATVLAVNAPGTIKTMKLLSPGQNFNKFDEATLVNTTQGNNVIVRSFSAANVSGGSTARYQRRQKTFAGTAGPKPSGVVTFPGRYVDTKGFLSWNNKLQDNFYYQEFSYVLRVGELLEKYSDIVKKVLHPSGTKIFNELVINSSAPEIVIIGLSTSNIQDVGVKEVAAATDVVVGRNNLAAVAAATQSVTATDALPTAITTKNVGHLESVSTSDSFAATYVGNHSTGSESVTAAETIGATYNSVVLNTGTESVTSTDIVVGGYSSVLLSSGTQSVTSTDNVVGNNNLGEVSATTQSVTATETVVGNNNLGNVDTGTQSVTADNNQDATYVGNHSTGTESVTSTDSQNASYVGNHSTGSESVTAAETIVGTYRSVVINSGTESITPIDNVGATYSSVLLNSGSESITAIDTSEAIVTLGAYLTETVTATDTNVGSVFIVRDIVENNGLISPYASTLISAYQSTNIGDFVYPVLNIDDAVNRS
jgi:hypothetical protein